MGGRGREGKRKQKGGQASSEQAGEEELMAERMNFQMKSLKEKEMSRNEGGREGRVIGEGEGKGEGDAAREDGRGGRQIINNGPKLYKKIEKLERMVLVRQGEGSKGARGGRDVIDLGRGESRGRHGAHERRGGTRSEERGSLARLEETDKSTWVKDKGREGKGRLSLLPLPSSPAPSAPHCPFLPHSHFSR